MGKKQTYSYETKMKVIEMKLANVPVNEIMKVCEIKNNTQIYQWVKWYKDGEVHRLQQPLGKQYSYGKGPFQEDLDEVTALTLQNEVLKLQLALLKKYISSERK